MASLFVTLHVIIAACLLLFPCLTSGNKLKGEFGRSLLNQPEKVEKDVCSSGKSQSPIDIITSETIINNTLQSLVRDLQFDNSSLHIDGDHVQVSFKTEGGLKIDGKTYNLKQVHWHTPSEHRLDGVQYAAELHEVHVADDGSRTVIGVLYKVGPPSKFLTKIKPELEKLAKQSCKDPKEKIMIPKLDSSLLKKNPGKYYRYTGSLTTPPCTENVLWNVCATVKSMSKEQIALIDSALCKTEKNNARPIQPLNGRKVQKYDGKEEYDANQKQGIEEL